MDKNLPEINVFLSYSWSEQNSKQVEIIDQAFKEFGIVLKRDIRDAKTGHSLSRFMDSIVTSDFVILFLSDSYLRSKNCLYEAGKALNFDLIGKNTLIVLDDTLPSDIFSAARRKQYYEYWDEELNNINGLISEFDNEDYLNQKIKIQKIIPNLSSFFTALQDIKCITYSDLIMENFKSFFDLSGLSNSFLFSKIKEIAALKDVEQQDIMLDEILQRFPENCYAWYMKGLNAKENNQTNRAIAFYKKAIEKNPKYAQAYNNLAIIVDDIVTKRKLCEKAIALDASLIEPRINLALYLCEDFFEFDAGRKCIENALAISPDSSAVTSTYGYILDEYFKDFDLAIQYYEQSIEQNPSLVFSYLKLAKLFYEKQDYDSERDLLLKLIEIDPKNVDAHLHLGILYHQKFHNYDKALFYYREANWLNNKECLPHSYIALLLTDHVKNYSEAKVHYETSIRIEPNDPIAHYNYAILLNKHFEDHMQAAKHYEIAITLDPNFILAYINLAEIQFSNFNDVAYTQALYETAYKQTQEDPHLNYNYAAFLASQKINLELALHLLNKNLAIDPSDYRPYTTIGAILKNEYGHNQDAKYYFEKALTLDPTAPDTHYNLGIILYAENDIENAKKQFKLAISYKKDYCDAYVILAELEKNDSAKKYYEMALHHDPNHELALLGYSMLLSNKYNEHVQAIKILKRLVEISPENIDAYVTISNIYWFKLNDGLLGRKYCELALKINNNHADANFVLALILKSAFSKNDLAREHYRKACFINPSLANFTRNLYFKSWKKPRF